MKVVWVKGFEVFRATWLLCLTVAVVPEIFPLFSNSRGGNTGLTIVLSAFVGYAMHRYILFGERPGQKSEDVIEKRHDFRFLMAALMLTGILILIFGLAFWALLANWGMATSQFAILLVFAIYGPVLALFGTILPHAAATGKIQPLLALSVGRKTFWQVLLGLLAGPLIVGVLVIGTFVLLAQMNIATSAEGIRSTFDPLGGVIGSLLGFFGLMASAQTSVILCKAYRTGGITNHAEVFQ